MSVTVETSYSDEFLAENTVSEDDVADGVPKLKLLQAWIDAAYLDTAPAIASLLVTTTSEIQALNKEYLDKDKPTNVLSFPMQSPEEVDVRLLGDIVLCAKIIKQEAVQQSKSEDSHWAHMVVHAMLHLQGYDHVNDEDAEKMEQQEIEILDQLGFDNPYQ